VRTILVVVFAVSAGCGDQKQAEPAIPDNLSDSASKADYEDSLMGKMSYGGPSVVTTYGDTLAIFSGWSIDVEPPPFYEIGHYSRNGIHYLGIERRGEHKPVGRPIWSRRFTLRLPAMDSSDRVVLHGYCRTNGKDDRLIFAITGTEGDSFYRPARHAWRFNVNREALEEIPIAGVTCSLVNPEGH
jgi:hypothetical protein